METMIQSNLSKVVWQSQVSCICHNHVWFKTFNLFINCLKCSAPVSTLYPRSRPCSPHAVSTAYAKTCLCSPLQNHMFVGLHWSLSAVLFHTSTPTHEQLFLLLAQAFTWVVSTKISSVLVNLYFIHSSRIFEKICVFKSVGILLSKYWKM